MRLSPDLERYRDHAVSFVARPRAAGAGRLIRVAHTLVTCATAARVLNQIGMPPEAPSAYRHVNVHNPRCPLFFSADAHAWS
jgi:hypothetical protein